MRALQLANSNPCIAQVAVPSTDKPCGTRSAAFTAVTGGDLPVRTDNSGSEYTLLLNNIFHILPFLGSAMKLFSACFITTLTKKKKINNVENIHFHAVGVPRLLTCSMWTT